MSSVTAGSKLVVLLLVATVLAVPAERIFYRDGYSGAVTGDLWQRLLLRWQAATAGSCTPGTKLSHPAALAMCQAVGIGIRSSTGKVGCRDPGCTSLEQVRCETVMGLLGFQRASGCRGIVITGGTELGHAGGSTPGLRSHYNGYKVDIALTDCIGGYIEGNFRYSHTRSDGARVYVDGKANEYAREKNHWDILYF